MNLEYGKQVTLAELEGKKVDLFLYAVNHERRAETALNRLKSIAKIHKSIALCYKKEHLSNTADKSLVIDEHSHISQILDEEIGALNEDEFFLVVDYSCMTKSWYYILILYLAKRNVKISAVNSFFIYTPSTYSPPQHPKPNSEIAPLPGKYVIPTDKPKALIVCLGYEQNKAEGIIDHLDPKISFLFYTDPAFDSEFVVTLKDNNKTLLENSSDRIITYPFHDLLFLERKLTSIYLSLREHYSIIIAPLGPKPFTFISMLLAAKYPDIDIWRVGSGSDINEYPREPISNETFLVSQIVWSKRNQ